MNSINKIFFLPIKRDNPTSVTRIWGRIKKKYFQGTKCIYNLQLLSTWTFEVVIGIKQWHIMEYKSTWRIYSSFLAWKFLCLTSSLIWTVQLMKKKDEQLLKRNRMVPTSKRKSILSEGGNPRPPWAFTIQKRTSAIHNRASLTAIQSTSLCYTGVIEVFAIQNDFYETLFYVYNQR